MEELWAEVEGFPNYIVSNYGEVVSVRTNKRLRMRSNRDGTLRVTLSHEGVIKECYVHQLVAKAFFGDYRSGLHVEHVNGDKTNNRTYNLRLKRGKGVQPNRERKAPSGQRVVILETGEVFRTVRDCARYIGGDYSSIYACLRGERKKHLGYTFEYYEGN